MSDSDNKDDKPNVVQLLPKLAKSMPRFAPETEIVERGMFVDMDGTAWWIDPFAKTIEKVEK